MTPPVGILRNVVAKGTYLIVRLAKSATELARNQASAALSQPAIAYARVTPKHPIHPSALLRQSKRLVHTYSHAVPGTRTFTSATAAGSGSGSRFAASSSRATSSSSSTLGSALKRASGFSPFASTLRPNLTGGALPRTAGGYCLGSGRVGHGARYFSHTPASAAQAVRNVSQAMRAFALGGQKAQFDGVDPRTGEKRYKSVTELQYAANKKLNSVPKASPGSYISYKVNPTITALTPLRSVAGFQSTHSGMETLNSEGLLDVLNVDFSRALQELVIIMNDLKSLSTLGDLPISYQDSNLVVHFPGVDAETVERIATELGLRRGVVGQDVDFDAFVGTEIALLFPFAPSESSDSQPSLYGKTVYDQEAICGETVSSILESSPLLSLSDEDIPSLPEISSPSGYETVSSDDLQGSSGPRSNHHRSPVAYQDFEGIYRFIELCNNAPR